MIKCIIFDLDGVLVEARQIHFHAFNQALQEVVNYTIPYEEHLANYDGLPTRDKLAILLKKKVVSHDQMPEIKKLKQKYTREAIQEYVETEPRILDMLKKLSENYVIYCASNSIRSTICDVLTKTKYIEYIDKIFSNEDVNQPKPHPEIYLRSVLESGFKPREVLVVEDSSVGRQAAYDAGCRVLGIQGTHELNYDLVKDEIRKIELKKDGIPKWKGGKMNILIPMAGKGSRFSSAGYTFPKPMIDVNGKTMIQTVVDNLNVEGKFIFVCLSEHVKQFNLDTLFSFICDDYEIVEVDRVTEGAACTTMLARELINNDEPLLIANSDQYMDWDSNEFMYSVTNSPVDGAILTFPNSHPKWSYVSLDNNGFVSEVAEKRVISNHANCGVFFFKKGSDYCRAVDEMIRNDDRVKGEFYVAPSINYLIKEGLKFKQHSINKMWGLGTPEDLENFLRNHE